MILYGLYAHEVKVLDAFEDEEYVKTEGSVLNKETGRPETVLYYVWHPSLESKLERRLWDPEAFREHHLREFTKMCVTLAADLGHWNKW